MTKSLEDKIIKLDDYWVYTSKGETMCSDNLEHLINSVRGVFFYKELITYLQLSIFYLAKPEYDKPREIHVRNVNNFLKKINKPIEVIDSKEIKK